AINERLGGPFSTAHRGAARRAVIQQLRPPLIGNDCFRGSVGRRDRSVPPPDAHPVPPCGTAMRGSLRRTRATAEQPVVRCDIWYDTREGPPSRENYVNCITFSGTTAEHQVGASVSGASWSAEFACQGQAIGAWRRQGEALAHGTGLTLGARCTGSNAQEALGPGSARAGSPLRCCRHQQGGRHADHTGARSVLRLIPSLIPDREVDRHWTAGGDPAAVTLVAIFTFIGNVLRPRSRPFEACRKGVVTRLQVMKMSEFAIRSARLSPAFVYSPAFTGAAMFHVSVRVVHGDLGAQTCRSSVVHRNPAVSEEPLVHFHRVPLCRAEHLGGSPMDGADGLRIGFALVVLRFPLRHGLSHGVGAGRTEERVSILLGAALIRFPLTRAALIRFA